MATRSIARRRAGGSAAGPPAIPRIGAQAACAIDTAPATPRGRASGAGRQPSRRVPERPSRGVLLGERPLRGDDDRRSARCGDVCDRALTGRRDHHVGGTQRRPRILCPPAARHSEGSPVEFGMRSGATIDLFQVKAGTACAVEYKDIGLHCRGVVRFGRDRRNG